MDKGSFGFRHEGRVAKIKAVSLGHFAGLDEGLVYGGPEDQNWQVHTLRIAVVDCLKCFTTSNRNAVNLMGR
jgi:hypothetical protein